MATKQKKAEAPAKRPAGRPTFVPTDKDRMTAEVMAACGFPHHRIAQRIINPSTGKHIDEKTLREHMRDELNMGMSSANALVAQSLFKAATGGGLAAVNAAKFWLACRAGWKPVEGVELTGKDGAPLPGAPSLSPEKFEEIAQRLNKEV